MHMFIYACIHKYKCFQIHENQITFFSVLWFNTFIHVFKGGMLLTINKFKNEAKFYILNLKNSGLFCWKSHRRTQKHTHIHTECLQVQLAHMHTPPDSSWTECPWLCELPYGLTGRERDWPPLVGNWRGGATVNKSVARSSPLWTAHHWLHQEEKWHWIIFDLKQRCQTLARGPILEVV